MTDTVNVPLLRKTLEWAYGEHLKAQRGEISEWNQGDWMIPTWMLDEHLGRDDVDVLVREGTACGTSCCIAGKVAYDEGWRMAEVGLRTIVRDGVHESPFNVGARLLGLTDAQAQELFNGTNLIRDLYRIAGEITDGEIQPPPGLESVR